MRALPVSLVLLALLLAGCGAEPVVEEEKKSAEEQPKAAVPEKPPSPKVEAMERLIADVAARPEKEAPIIQVRHILIAFAGAERSEATRSQDEARELAAKLLEELQGGADFMALMKKHSNDPGEGVYTMTDQSKSKDVRGTARTGMVPAFGNTGWRLGIREIGVADYHPTDSPFGYHIIQRIQ